MARAPASPFSAAANTIDAPSGVHTAPSASAPNPGVFASEVVREERPRLAIAGDIHHPQVRLRLVHPLIPVADRKRVVDARLRLRVLLLERGLAVRVLVAPRRATAPPGTRSSSPSGLQAGALAAVGAHGDSLRVAAPRHVHHVDLRHLVVIAAGRERQPPAVGAPGGAALAAALAVNRRGGALPSAATIQRSVTSFWPLRTTAR